MASMKKLAKRIVPAKVVKDAAPYWHLATSIRQQTLAGFPARGIEVIGVTGTDGKTSTCTLITHMLRSAGKKVAMMSTISVDYGDGKGPVANPTRLTTFSAQDLVTALKRMKQEGVEFLVLEITSHALAQYRTWGIPISIAVMTNIGHEHLDYHGTFENYRDAKRRLFKLANKNKQGRRIGIINAEDPSAQLFASDILRPITYGTKQADILANNIAVSPAGSQYDVTLKNTSSINYQASGIEPSALHITCHLPGRFNIYNSLAAASVGLAIGLTTKEIEQGIRSLKAVEGRMTRVDEGQNFDVIVDYAHTPESFEKLFAEIKPLTKNRLICVFGSAGRRDLQKRAKQGAIAGKWCDIVVVTEEDDRDMDGEAIMRQIVAGAEQSGKILNKDVLMVGKREEAVQMALQVAKAGDVVMLLGKGHEKSILTNGPRAAELRHLPQDDDDEQRVVKRPYDEVSVVRNYLGK